MVIFARTSNPEIAHQLRYLDHGTGLLNKAYRLNELYDLRMQGFSIAEIAEYFGLSRVQIRRNLKELMQCVSPKTAELLRNPKKRPSEAYTAPKAPLMEKTLKVAYRRNKVLDLRMQGLTLREIANKVGVSHEQVRLDLAAIRRAVSPETREKLRAITEQLKNRRYYSKELESLPGLYDRTLKLFWSKSRKEVEAELARVEKCLAEEQDVNKRNRLIVQRNALRAVLNK